MLVRTRRSWALLMVGLLTIAGYTVLLTRAMDTQSYNTWGGMIVLPCLLAANIVLLWFVNRREPDRWIAGLVTLAFYAKMLGVLGRYYVSFVVYSGVADAARYNLYAAEHYFNWRQGFFVWDEGGKPGTHNMELITTAVYTVIGPSTVMGFFVFGSFAFWGAYLLLKAFRVALPDANHRRYAVLVLLLPSMLYWPSSIGKEAWILLFVGVTAYGAARYFQGATATGLGVMALGVVGTAMIRPHVTVLMVAALLVAQITRPTGHASTNLLTKGAGAFILVVAAWILITQSAEWLGIDDLSWQAVVDEMEWAAGQTAQGGSAFEPVPLDSPFGVPAAIVTLLFRPFPWEAGNVQMLAQSLEGVALIALTVASWPRLKTLPGVMRRNPYVVFSAVYVLIFILAFAEFANFGILARQRVLMMPFFLVLLALPRPARRLGRGERLLTRKEAEVAYRG